MNLNQKERRRKIWGNLWFSFFVLYFINMLIASVIILFMRPLWYDINEFLIGMIGIRFNWLTLIVSLIFITFAHSLYLVVSGTFKLSKQGLTHAGWGHKIVPFIFLPIWDFALILLFSEAGSEVSIIRNQLEYYSPLFWLVSIILLSILGPSLYRMFIQTIPQLRDKRVKWFKKGILIDADIMVGVICILVIGAPFVIIPSNVITEEIPPKPNIIAHRGASHLAPENTMIAAEQALFWGADGIEVDLTMSIDGVIILCHDDTLRRTTNVAEIFPSRQNNHVSSFTFAELRSLDAGSWFVDSDPFKTIKKGYINQTTAESYRGEQIPSLEEILNFTRDNGLLLDIDSKGLPSGHPYAENYTTTLLTMLNKSGMGKDILIGSNNYLAENMTYVTGALPIDELNSIGSELVNTHHGLPNSEFISYEKAGIDVMCWTVDLVSRFSQLWLLGVDYIKTNDLHIMGPLTKPIWNMKLSVYLITWTILIIIVPTLSFTLDYVFRKKNKRTKK